MNVSSPSGAPLDHPAGTDFEDHATADHATKGVLVP